MAPIGGIMRIVALFQQKLADGAPVVAGCFSGGSAQCQSACVAVMSSNMAVAKCQNRYPSPDRSDPLWTRPVTLFTRHGAAIVHDIEYQPQTGLEFVQQNDDSAVTFKSSKGRKLCLKKHGSSQRQPHLVSQAVSKLTASAHLLVQALAVLPMKRCAMAIVQTVHLQVLLLARCLTTSLAAKRSAFRGDYVNFDRRRGYPPAAVFRLKDC